jgi:hypothetical protein
MMRMRAFVYVGWLLQAQTVHEAGWAELLIGCEDERRFWTKGTGGDGSQ